MSERFGPVGRLALVQPRVGIGDMVWHLPHIRALARQAGGAVTLVTRPRSMADQLVGPEDGVADIFWVERDQWMPEGRHRGLAGMVRLIAELRARRFDAAVLLTRSRMLTFAAAAAGIPIRYGYGVGAQQRLLLNRRPYLPDAALARHPYDQAGAWLAAAGIAVEQPEPRLSVTGAAQAAARARLGPAADAPFVALGIAASDAWKKWDPARFAALASHLLAAGWSRMVLLGGPAEQADAAAILGELAPADAARVIPALGWDLREVTALLAESGFYLGNDTAVLNIAAAVGTRAYGLFGGTPVLRHSPSIVPIVPPGGPDRDAGMARIPLAAVLDTVRADRGGLAPGDHPLGSPPSSARPTTSGIPIA